MFFNLRDTKTNFRQASIKRPFSFLDLRGGTLQNREMIVCTKCGESNPEDGRFCRACGRKLQSERRLLPGASLESRLAEVGQGVSLRGRGLVFKCLEILGLLAGIAAALAWGAYSGVWWPLYTAVILAALLLRFRGI